MLHCPKCDEPVNRQCRFCPHCGLPLADDAHSDETLLGEPLPVAAWDSGSTAPRWRLYAIGAAAALLLILGITAITLNGNRGREKRPTVVRTRPGGSSLYGAPAGGSFGRQPTNPGLPAPLQMPGAGAPMAAMPPAGVAGVAPGAPGGVAPRSPAGGNAVPPGSILYRHNGGGVGPEMMPGVPPRPAPSVRTTARVMPSPFVGTPPADTPPAPMPTITANGDIPEDAAAPATAPMPPPSPPAADNPAPATPPAAVPPVTPTAPAAPPVAGYPAVRPMMPMPYAGYGGYGGYGAMGFRSGPYGNVNTIPWAGGMYPVRSGMMPPALGPMGFYGRRW